MENVAKKQRIDEQIAADDVSEITEDEHEEAVREIEEEYKKGKKARNMGKLKSLIDKTRWRRRMWIENESISV